MCALSFRSRGSGFPLLLLHGFGVTYNIWENLSPLLAANFRLIMVELPGMGQASNVPCTASYYTSCSDYLEEIRKELKIEKWSVFSYSIGTRVAEEYVTSNVDRIDKCVFLCPLYIPGLRWKALSLLKFINCRFPQLTSYLLSDWRLFGLVILLGFNGRLDKYARSWTDEIASQDVDLLKKVLSDLPNPGKQLFDLPVPSLYIYGRQDLVTARFSRKDKNIQYVQANHSAPLSAADQVARISIPFLDS